MELDPKIKVKKIFDVFSDFEEVKKYYGKRVYCADFIENFSNLKLYTDRKILKTFFPQECKPFLCSGKQHRYVLPCEFVEQEKQYRPFKDTKEFFIKTNFEEGDLIHIRSKNKIEYWLMLVGWTNNRIKLGTDDFTFENLFENFELWDGEENFIPFGVEVTE